MINRIYNVIVRIVLCPNVNNKILDAIINTRNEKIINTRNEKISNINEKISV
jgi:hypothetical protein